MNRQELLELTQKARKNIEDKIDFTEEYKDVMKKCINAAQYGEQTCLIRIGELENTYGARLRLKLLIEKLEKDEFAVSKTTTESGAIYLKIMW